MTTRTTIVTDPRYYSSVPLQPGCDHCPTCNLLYMTEVIGDRFLMTLSTPDHSTPYGQMLVTREGVEVWRSQREDIHDDGQALDFHLWMYGDGKRGWGGA